MICINISFHDYEVKMPIGFQLYVSFAVSLTSPVVHKATKWGSYDFSLRFVLAKNI